MATEKTFNFSTSGVGYEIDIVNKTCRKVMRNLLEEEDTLMGGLLKEQASLKIYHKALKEKFKDEVVKLNKGVILFRGYRIRFADDEGFVIEDTTSKLAEAKTFEELPTLDELTSFFKEERVIEHSPEDLRKAYELGKALQKQKEEFSDDDKTLEDYRKEVIQTLKTMEKKGKGDTDLNILANAIPYKKWRRKAKALVVALNKREIRFKKFVSEMKNVTESETFGAELKNKRNKFSGTLLEAYKEVGLIYGNKIEVDNRLVDAVPFLQNYILYYEPKVMPQLMKFAKSEITDTELLSDPYKLDCFEEYNRGYLKNTEENTAILSALFDVVGIVTPQDLLYTAAVEVGDKIKVWDEDKFKVKTVTSLEDGVVLSGGVGLLKVDKWFKVIEK